MARDFYDQLTSRYHLVYPDWESSMRRQGEQLAALIEAEWPGRRRVLDVSCGIGTQAIGLALKGYSVTASDLSPNEVARAQGEASRHGVDIAFSVADMREAHMHHGDGHEVVVSADNSLPHLLGDDEILTALKQMAACVPVGGGCIVTVRDYEREERGRNLVKPYGVRVENGRRHLLFQVWDFVDEGKGDCYDLGFYFVEEDLATGAVQTHVMRSRYYAISTGRLCELMREAGFDHVRRLDGVFFQPVLVGTRRD